MDILTGGCGIFFLCWSGVGYFDGAATVAKAGHAKKKFEVAEAAIVELKDNLVLENEANGKLKNELKQQEQIRFMTASVNQSNCQVLVKQLGREDCQEQLDAAKAMVQRSQTVMGRGMPRQ